MDEKKTKKRKNEEETTQQLKKQKKDTPSTIHDHRKEEVIKATALLADLAWIVSKYAAGVSGLVKTRWETLWESDRGGVYSMAYDETEDLLYFSLHCASGDFLVMV